MRTTLQSCLKSDGLLRPATTALPNKNFTPIEGGISNIQALTKSDIKDYIIGDQVLNNT